MYSCLVISIVVLRSQGVNEQWQVASVVFLQATLKLFSFGPIFQTFGVLAQIMYEIMIGDLVQFSLIFVIIWLGFSGAIFIGVEAGSNAAAVTALLPEISSFGEVLLSNFRVLVSGEPVYDFEDFRSLQDTLQSIYLMLFYFFTIVVMLNMLVALMSDTYGRVQEEAAKTYVVHDTKTGSGHLGRGTEERLERKSETGKQVAHFEPRSTS